MVEVSGRFDHVSTVLRATGVPFVPVAPGQLDRVDWNKAQVAWVNCPGQLPSHEVALIAE